MFCISIWKGSISLKNSMAFATPGNGPLLNLLKMPHLPPPPSMGKEQKLQRFQIDLITWGRDLFLCKSLHVNLPDPGGVKLTPIGFPQ